MRSRRRAQGRTARRLGAPARLRALISVAVAILALAVAGLAAALEPASGRDGFNGTIVKATGSFAGARGAAAIQLFPTRSAGNIRTMTLSIGPLACPAGGGRCLQLRGQATGTMGATGPPPPDVGVTLQLNAVGRVAPLGRVSVTGTVHGTGFMSKGHEWLLLWLTSSRRGAVRVEAVSPLVPGFTSP